MISKTIKYVDYNGVEKIGTYWFNMSRADLIDLEMKGEEGWFDRIKKLVNEQRMREAYVAIEQFIKDSYGVKTPDGGFDKDPKHLKAFRDSEAYSIMMWEFVNNPETFADFVNGIVASVKKSVDAVDIDARIAEATKKQGQVMDFVTPSNT